MSKFNVGDKVFVTGNSYYSSSVYAPERGWNLVGRVCEIRAWDGISDDVSVWAPGKSDWWMVNKSDIYAIHDAPKEITLNGATYVLKEEPKADHEWKFGDVAVHDEYGVGIVFSKTFKDNNVFFAHDGDWDWANLKDLTFLRRADLSV